MLFEQEVYRFPVMLRRISPSKVRHHFALVREEVGTRDALPLALENLHGIVRLLHYRPRNRIRLRIPPDIAHVVILEHHQELDTAKRVVFVDRFSRTDFFFAVRTPGGREDDDRPDFSLVIPQGDISPPEVMEQ